MKTYTSSHTIYVQRDSTRESLRIVQKILEFSTFMGTKRKKEYDG